MEKLNLLLTPIQKLQKFYQKIFYLIHYCSSSEANYYICKLVGEKNISDSPNTVILYRMLGKRDLFEISVNDLLDNKELLEKFHPTEAVKFGAIAMGDILFNLPEEQRPKRFAEIKQKMLESTIG